LLGLAETAKLSAYVRVRTVTHSDNSQLAAHGTRRR
jgi:hypothetical protein